MTTIAAFISKSEGAMGADTGVYNIDSDLQQSSNHPKIFLLSHSNMMIGVAGSLKALNAAASFSVDKMFSRFENVTTFAEYMQAADIKGDWEALIYRDNGLFYMDQEGGWTRMVDPYCAIGAGQAVALGSLYQSHMNDADSARSAVTTSLMAVAKHTSCQDGIQVHTFPK